MHFVTLTQKTVLAFFVLLCLSLQTFADALWIDVRSAEEYAEDHIQGDININFKDIGDEIDKHVSDKDAEIQLYCRSGGRAGVAFLQLTAMGYKNVHNAGGINDVRKVRNIK